MSNAAQKIANQNYRKRLSSKGVSRWEVQGLENDKDISRALLKALAKNDNAANEFRQKIQDFVGVKERTGSDLVAALRKAALGGVDLDIIRENDGFRKVDFE